LSSSDPKLAFVEDMLDRMLADDPADRFTSQQVLERLEVIAALKPGERIKKLQVPQRDELSLLVDGLRSDPHAQGRELDQSAVILACEQMGQRVMAALGIGPGSREDPHIHPQVDTGYAKDQYPQPLEDLARAFVKDDNSMWANVRIGLFWQPLPTDRALSASRYSLISFSVAHGQVNGSLSSVRERDFKSFTKARRPTRKIRRCWNKPRSRSILLYAADWPGMSNGTCSYPPIQVHCKRSLAV
jgi:hypothetical protein